MARQEQATFFKMVPTFSFIASNAKSIVSSIVGLIILYESESWIPTFYVFGAFVTAVLSKILKLIIREKRPKNKSSNNDFGMPSSHSSSLFYFANILSVQLFQRMQISNAILFIVVLCLYFYAFCARYD
jgi:hypothetical protein